MCKYLPPAILFAFISMATSSAAAQGLGRGSVDAPVMEWPVADPDSMGLNLDALKEHQELCLSSGASGCLVAYKGYVVQEWYSPDFPGEPTYMQPWIGTRSAVKSFASILAGMLIADGKIESVQDPVSKYIPEWKAGADSSVTIRHLLTMTSGVAKHAGDGPRAGVVAAKNTSAYVLELPLEQSPGERWAYSNESAQLLSPILERAAGMPLAAYASERLFEPIGMSTTYMMIDTYYNTVTLGGTMTRLGEFARIAQLMSNEGMWNGDQIVPADWVRESTQPLSINERYGYLWWVSSEYGSYNAAGSFDQVIHVFPELDLITARLQRDGNTGVPASYRRDETKALLRRIVVGDSEEE